MKHVNEIKRSDDDALATKKHRLLFLADMMEKGFVGQPEKFEFEWKYCIAGHAVALFAPEIYKTGLRIASTAKRILMLSYSEYYDLFLNYPMPSKKLAINRIRELARVTSLPSE